MDSKLFSLLSKTRLLFTKNRSMVISKEFLNTTILVYDGLRYVRLPIQTPMLGHRLGEFVFTKKLGSSIHSSARNKKRAAQRKMGKKK